MFVSKEHLPQSSDPVRHPAPSSAPAHTSPRFDQERENASFILNTLRTLFLAPKLQPSHSQTVAHSFTHDRSLTPALPTTCKLSPRSSAKERKLTLFLSCIPARFCRNGGYGANKERKSPGPCRRFRAEVRSGAKVPGVAAHVRKRLGCTCSPREKLRENPSRMNTYAKCAANPNGMRTYKIIGLKASCNELEPVSPST
jgi:hypothetical protein